MPTIENPNKLIPPIPHPEIGGLGKIDYNKPTLETPVLEEKRRKLEELLTKKLPETSNKPKITNKQPETIPKNNETEEVPVNTISKFDPNKSGCSRYTMKGLIGDLEQKN